MKKNKHCESLEGLESFYRWKFEISVTKESSLSLDEVLLSVASKELVLFDI